MIVVREQRILWFVRVGVCIFCITALLNLDWYRRDIRIQYSGVQTANSNHKKLLESNLSLRRATTEGARPLALLELLAKSDLNIHRQHGTNQYHVLLDGFPAEMYNGIQQSLEKQYTLVKAKEEWDLKLCLDECDQERQNQGQRIGHISHLTELLANEKSFCVIANRLHAMGTEFGEHVFQCWVLPDEAESLAGYIDSQPQVHFRVTPTNGQPQFSVLPNMVNFDAHSTVQRATGVPTSFEAKFYVLVTSILPARLYLYSDGFVKERCTQKSKSRKQTVRVRNSIRASDCNSRDSNQWEPSQTALVRAFGNQVAEEAMRSLRKSIAMIFIVMEELVRQEHQQRGLHCEYCFQVIQVDAVIDSNGKPRISGFSGPSAVTTTDDNSCMWAETVDVVLGHAQYMFEKMTEKIDNNILSELPSKHQQYIVDTIRESEALDRYRPILPSNDQDEYFAVSQLLEKMYSHNEESEDLLRLSKVAHSYFGVEERA